MKTLILTIVCMLASVAGAAWVSPISHETTSGDYWYDCGCSYDGDILTYSGQRQDYYQEPLELVFSAPVLADQWRIMAVQAYGDLEFDPILEVWLFYDNAWRCQYEADSVIPAGQWFARELWGDYPEPQGVSAIRITSLYPEMNLHVFEFQVYEIPEPATLVLLVCGSMILLKGKRQ